MRRSGQESIVFVTLEDERTTFIWMGSCELTGTGDHLHRLGPIPSACTTHAHIADWSCDTMQY